MKSLDIDTRGQFIEFHIPDFDRVEKKGGIGGEGMTRYEFFRANKIVAQYYPRSFSGNLEFGELVILSPGVTETEENIQSNEVFAMSFGKIMDSRIKNKIQELV